MLHMIKLVVGCDTPQRLQELVFLERIDGQAFVRTRTMPRRIEEILPPGKESGSIYRVMNGLILCRQPITGFKSYIREDGHQGTLILVSDDVIQTVPRPMRAFQGWRYFKGEDAPPDLYGPEQEAGETLPEELRYRLAELALP